MPGTVSAPADELVDVRGGAQESILLCLHQGPGGVHSVRHVPQPDQVEGSVVHEQHDPRLHGHQVLARQGPNRQDLLVGASAVRCEVTMSP